MQTQILQNPALTLPHQASDPYGDEVRRDSVQDNKSFALKLPTSLNITPSSFSEEGEDALVQSCGSKKLCFTCLGGSWNTAFYVTFKHKAGATRDKFDRCTMSTVFKISRGVKHSKIG